MCRKNRVIGVGLAALGGGLLIATIFPRGFIVFIVGVILTAAGVILLTKS